MDVFFNRCIAKPAWVILASLVLFLIASFGCTKLTFSTNYRTFFSDQNPHLQAFESLQSTYTKNDNALIVIEPKAGNVFSPEILQAILEITEDSWQLPYSIRVDSITNYQHTYADEDELVVADLVEDLPALTYQQLLDLKAIAISEPSLVNRLISPEATITGVNVTFQLPGVNQAEEVPIVAGAVRDLKAKYEAKYPINIRLSGVIFQNQAFTDSSMQDAKTLMPLMFVVICLGVGLLFRSWYASLIIVVIMIFSIFPALGVAGWFGLTLNTATMTSPIMIMTLAVADSVHVFSNFFSHHQENGNKLEALKESLRINFQPILLTSVTTILGFLSLNFSDAPPFRELGNIVAVGVAFALLYSLTLLPALLSLLPVKPKRSRTDMGFESKLADVVIKYENKLFYGIGLFVILCVGFIPLNQLNDVWIDYFSPKLEFRQDADYVAQNLTGVGAIHYSIKADGPEGVSSPEFLNHIQHFKTWLELQPEVVHVDAITDTFKRLNKSLHADDSSYYILPDSKQLAAQYLLLYELSLPYGLDLNNQLNIDKSATRIHVTLKKLSTNGLLDFEDRAKAYQKQHMPTSMHADGTSPDVMFAYIGFTNIRQMLKGTTLALILISGLLIFAFRSFKYGMLSLLPNLLPAGIAFGLWGLFVGEVGLSLSVVTGMTLGIIVDDTIHFMSKYLKAAKTQNLEEALHTAFNLVGKALVVTTVVLAAGFGILALSTFRLNASMGLLTAMTIVLALLVDFFFLPACLLKVARRAQLKESEA